MSDNGSDDEIYNDLVDFDLFELNDSQRNRVSNILQHFDADLDEENLDLLDLQDYEPPAAFEWTRNYAVHCVHPFREQTGPVRVFDTSATPL